MMTPDGLEGLAAGVPLAPGYRFTALQRREIRLLADSVKRWFPEISVGSAACTSSSVSTKRSTPAYSSAVADCSDLNART